jgi:hypothetical protein
MAALIGLASLASPLQADLWMEHDIKVTGGGNLKMLSSEGTIQTWISDQKSRSEARMESKSTIMTMMGKNLDTTSITRIDQGRILNLVPEKKQYSVVTFEQMRAQMEGNNQQLEEMQSEQGGALPVRGDECQWSEAEMNLRSTGEKQRFANVKAEQHIITVEQTCTVPESGKTCDISWIMDNWLAKRMPGEKEAHAFNEALAAELGTESLASGINMAARGLLTLFRDGWEEISDEVEALRGYPVKTVMVMRMGGEACTMNSGEPIATDDIWNDAAQASLESGANAAGYHAGSAAARGVASATGGGVAGSIAGSVAGAAGREVVSGMLKKWGRKKEPAEPATETAPQEAEGSTVDPAAASVVLFQIESTLVGVSDKATPATLYEVDEDWEEVAGWP